jgi:methyl-accepting chemotaxis protein
MRNLESAAQHYPIAKTANEFEREILNARIQFIYFVTIEKPGALDSGRLHYKNARKKLADLQNQIQSLGPSDGLQPMVRKLSSATDKYDSELNGIIEAVQDGIRSGPNYDLLVKNWAEAGATMVQASAQLQEAANKDYTDAQIQAASSLRTIIILGVLIIVFGAATGVACAYMSSRSIRNDLRDASLQLEQGAEQVASAASQVSASAHSLAEGASKQAALLQDTTVSSQKVDSISQKNTERAYEAHSKTDSVSTCISDTQQKLQATLCSMTDIVAASEQISKVATVIDGIAFQTNILALNAAVEAARAGQHGLGFAVVADEVRNLAQRSSQSARETQDLIESTIAKSKEGNDRLQALSDSIAAISAQLKEVRTLVREVSDGSQEQKRVLAEVTTAVLEIDQVTQQSAATAQQTAAAGTQLEAQSDSMRALVANLSVLIGSNNDFATTHSMG